MAIKVQNTNQKPGYQRTEIGTIPDDWEVKELGEIAPLQRGFDLPTSHLQIGTYPVVYSNGILNHHSSFKVKAPGIVTGRSGTIGKVNYIEDDYWPHNTSLWVTDFKGNLPKFIYYLYVDIRLERFGTGSGVPTLNRNDVHRYQLLLPPLSEQQAITTTLGDVDALLTSLDALIDKKRDIKQAMMQQLLTGKTRLPGFNREWKVKKLKDECELITKGTTPTSLGKSFSTQGINFVKIESLTDEGYIIWDKLAFIDEETHNLLRR